MMMMMMMMMMMLITITIIIIIKAISKFKEDSSPHHFLVITALIKE